MNDEEEVTPNNSNVYNEIVDGDQNVVTATCDYESSTPPLRGRYVTIRRKNNSNVEHLMNFCEVEVLSCPPGLWGYNSRSSQDCSNFCDRCKNSSETCRVSDGYCFTGCEDGYWGRTCVQCNCPDGALCNQTDGSCPSGECKYVNIWRSTKGKMANMLNNFIVSMR